MRKRTSRPRLSTPRAKRMRLTQMRKRATSRLANLRTGGFLGIEQKFLDCAWDGVSVATSTDGTGGNMQPSSGCTNALSVPAQGDGESQRDGRKYGIRSVWVSGVLDYATKPDQTDPSDFKGCWLALVLDTQANGATIATGDCFINPSTSTQGMLPQPLRNLQNSKRFRVLSSQYIRPGGAYGFTDGANTGSVVPQVSQTVNMSWKGNITCDSIGTTANITSASDNAIHLVGFSGNDTVVFNGKSRVRFIG